MASSWKGFTGFKVRKGCDGKGFQPACKKRERPHLLSGKAKRRTAAVGKKRLPDTKADIFIPTAGPTGQDIFRIRTAQTL
jgi:hypothetical protein